MEPLGWSITVKGNYNCMCYRFKAYELEDTLSHMPEDLNGFCEQGLKCTAKDKYECICGEKFYVNKTSDTPRNQAYNHVCVQFDGNIRIKCVTNFRNKCQKCDLQLDSPSALKLHYESKSHLNFGTKVELYCKVCNIHYRGQREMLTHLETAKHKKLAKKH